MEWLCAAIIFCTGVHLLAFPAAFIRPSMAGLALIMSYSAWTTLLIGMGIARMLALWVNGHWPAGTPKIRLVGAIFGTLVFGVFAGAFVSVSQWAAWHPAITVYLGLMIGDAVSSGFAMADMIHARRAMR